MKTFPGHLKRLEEQGRYRSLSSEVRGVDLTSNDYLGLAGGDYLRESARRFFEEGGAVGSGASRLLRGHHEAHLELEAFAADYFGAERALFFASGFQANIALFQALPARGDVIVFDELVHASARQGIQASAAKHIKARHNDTQDFEDALKRAKELVSSGGQIWIAVESVYSMDGDFAPLESLYALAVAYDAVLIVDEAHGVGVCGPRGKGVSEVLVQAHGYERLITLHTCGKAIGVAGGLVCGSADVIEYLINTARGFIYSTAPMPVQAHLVQKSLEFIGSEEGRQRRQSLASVCDCVKLKLGGEGSHIVPIILGADEVALVNGGIECRLVRATLGEG